jgi:hypothetical protein
MNIPEGKIAIFLCDITGKMAEPWVAAGYHCVLVDPQHPTGIHTDGLVTRIGDIIIGCTDYLGALIRTGRVVFVMGFPPCTDVAVSGSLHFEKKRQKDPHFQAKAALVAEQCRMTGMLSGVPWAFENPVSVFSSIFGESNHGFHPWWFTGICLNDNYTKNTRLWVGGGFAMPNNDVHPSVQQSVDFVTAKCGRMFAKPKAIEMLSKMGASDEEIQMVRDWYPDDRIHKAAPGDERANFRSATPSGFAMAVYLANAPHLKAAANDNNPAAEAAA